MWGAVIKKAIKPEIEIANSPNLLRLFDLSVRSHMSIGGDWTTFVKVMAKKLMHPISRTPGPEIGCRHRSLF